MGLAGCSNNEGNDKPGDGGGSAGGPETPGAIELWLPSPFGGESTATEKSVWEDMLKTFEEEKNVEVNVTVIPWASYEEKYLTGVSSGEGPDVGYMYTEMMGDYIAQGALAPFDDFMSAEDSARMLYLDQGKLDDKQYALPFVVGGMRVLWANMDVLEEAGVTSLPETWDEYREALVKVQDTGKNGILQEWGAPDRGMLNSTFFPLLWQAGGNILSEDGTKTAFNSPEGIEAATFLSDLVESGVMPSKVSGLLEEDVKEAFYGGQSGFMMGNDGMVPEIEEAGINAEFISSLEGNEKGTFVASDSLVMLDACSDKQLCSDLAMFLLGGEQMTIMHEKIVSYPPVTTDEEPDMSNPFTQAYVEQADMLHSLPVAAGGVAVYNSLYTNLQQMILGQKSPEEALQDAASEGDSALSGG